STPPGGNAHVPRAAGGWGQRLLDGSPRGVSYRHPPSSHPVPHTYVRHESCGCAPRVRQVHSPAVVHRASHICVRRGRPKENTCPSHPGARRLPHPTPNVALRGERPPPHSQGRSSTGTTSTSTELPRHWCSPASSSRRRIPPSPSSNPSAASPQAS